MEASSFIRPSPRKCGDEGPASGAFQVKDCALTGRERRLVRDAERELANRAALHFDVERRQWLTLERFAHGHPNHRNDQPIAKLVDLPHRSDRGDTSHDDPLGPARTLRQRYGRGLIGHGCEVESEQTAA